VRFLAPAVLLGVLMAPAAAAARTPEPLVDLPPQTTRFADRVIEGGGAPPRARAAAAARPYATPDGTSVSVEFSPSYPENPEVAQTYVNFLGSLPHGTELARLKLMLAPPDEVRSTCGGVEGVLACYDGRTHTMVVPGEQIESESGVTTSYVVAHEYGHHVAAYRSNPPFTAMDWGPKFWSSYTKVCDKVLAGRLVPGAEGRFYTANPGESWAEVYARLKYPDEPWRFTRLLKPDAAALGVAQRDVLQPWTTPRRKTFTGTFGGRGTTDVHRFAFPLTLDGGLRVTLHGPSRAKYDIGVSSLGQTRGKTRGNAARDKLSWRAACRQRRSEQVTVTVSRRQGSGKFSVDVTYAG